MSPAEKYKNIIKLLEVSNNDLKEMKKLFHVEYLNNQFYVRLIFRNFFSIIESYLYSYRELIKLKIRTDNIDFPFDKEIILNQKEVLLDSKGKVKTGDKFFNFKSSFMFTFNCISEVFEVDEIDLGNNNFENIIHLSKRRNDITHPKDSEKQKIAKEEFISLIKGFAWFTSCHSSIMLKVNFWITKKNN